jgi:hypothetical protein
METQFTNPPHLTFQVLPGKTAMFTTLLQTGIRITADYGTTIGVFLASLPGFTEDYINDQVQTIFLNGTATDDLETPLDVDKPVLAISAAMPGLAGAIFRKNSLHAALRTTQTTHRNESAEAMVAVTLKLFNAIARDRGEQLLKEGVTMEAASVRRFFETREALRDLIDTVRLEDTFIAREDLMATLSAFDTIHLSIRN